MKIGILTTFYNFERSYSLTSVVENQLLSLVRHNYEPVLFVLGNFEGEVPEGVEVRKVIPQFELVDYRPGMKAESSFQEQAKSVQKALEKNMQDIDVAITHDWIFQGWFLPYNQGMRDAKLNCRWLHWVHSAPSDRPTDLEYPHTLRYTVMPNSKLIYLNHYDTLRLAEMYGGVLDDVRTVSNPLDPRVFYDYHSFTNELINKYRLMDADIIDVYPLSSTRFAGKQPEKVIKIIANLKKQGKSVRMIFCNAHANGENEKQAVRDLVHLAIEYGLTREEVIFTSLEGKDGEYEQGVPHKVVRDLFTLSNLFIFPTLSENCPLILLEAAMAKCLLVLNDSFPPLRDFFKQNALYFKFGSTREKVEHQDEEKYYSDIASIILGEFNKDKALNSFVTLRKEFNLDYVFQNQLEPLFHEEYAKKTN